MPLYEYECVKCHHRFEKIERVTASVEKTCPACGGKAERLLASPAIQFKGSGWYVTDYARQGTSSPAKDKDKDKDKADGQKPPREAAESKDTPAKKEKEKTSKP